MEFKELIQITKRLFRDYVKKYFSRLLFALSLSLVVAGSTAAIAWLLDPAVKKIFIDKDTTYAYLIPILIIIAFSTKGLSLYFARINVIKVGSWIQGKIQKQLANKILLSDIQKRMPFEENYFDDYSKQILLPHMFQTSFMTLH